MKDFLSGSFSDIINGLLNFLYFLLDFLFGWISVPQMPEEFIKSINTFFDLIFDNLSLLGFFIRPSTIKILCPLVIFVINFKYIYKIIRWFIQKIPWISIS